MSKDNIIQFPTSHKPSRKTKLDVYKHRLKELEVENEYLTGDIDYLSAQLETNLDEMNVILNEMKKLHEESLQKQVTELKEEFGVDLTKVVEDILHDQDNPKED